MLSALGPDIPGLPMMNFEEKTKGWDIIFKGLISPFANRFKKYIQMEMNSHLRDNDSDGDNSDEEMLGIFFTNLFYIKYSN